MHDVLGMYYVCMQVLTNTSCSPTDNCHKKNLGKRIACTFNSITYMCKTRLPTMFYHCCTLFYSALILLNEMRGGPDPSWSTCWLPLAPFKVSKSVSRELWMSESMNLICESVNGILFVNNWIWVCYWFVAIVVCSICRTCRWIRILLHSSGVMKLKQRRLQTPILILSILKLSC